MKRLFFSTALALFTISTLAQCTGFLILKDQKIYSDEDGKEEIQKNRKDFMIGIPNRNSSWYMGAIVKIDDSFVQTKVGVCFLDKAKVNGKSGLMQLWISDKVGVGSGWLNPKESTPLKYDVGVGVLIDFKFQSGGANMAALIKVALLEMDRLNSANFKAPEIENQTEFTASFDDTWSAMIETLSDGKWQIESIDKNSGLITTRAAVDHGGSTMVCSTAFDRDHKTWLNIFVKKTEKGTRVKVNATFHAIREDEVITCYSNGTIEKEIFEGIKKAIGGENK